MALFRRKQESDNQQVPLEIQDYYNAERRERAGVAWVLAFGTLVVTLLLAMGIFFGGRWVYRKATKPTNVAKTTNTTQSTTSSSEQASTNQSVNAPGSSSTGNPSSAASQPTPATQSTPASPNTSTSASSSNSSKTVAAANTNLPNTGPGDVLAAFAITAVIATSLYQLHLRRSRNFY